MKDDETFDLMQSLQILLPDEGETLKEVMDLGQTMRKFVRNFGYGILLVVDIRSFKR
jgi:hypothetical protein